MKRKPRLCFAVLICALLVTLVTSSAPAQTPRYVVTDLGDLPGGSDSTRGYGLNNLGQVVGGSRTTNPAGGTSGLQHPFLWTPSRPNGTTGSMIDLGTFGNSTSGSARAINDSGQVVGDDGHQSFLWTPESPNGATGSTAVVGPPVADYHARTVAAINNRGQVVGTNDPGILPQHGYLWTPDRPNGPTGTLTEFPDLPGGYELGVATATNAGGQVTGSGNVANLPGDAEAGIGARIRPFIWNPSVPNGPAGAMTALVVPDEYSAADAAGINDSGQVVGRAMSGRGPRAFVWTPDSPGASTGTTLLLNSLDTSGVSEAGDINNHGQVVGWSYGGRAFLWDADGGMRDLNLLLDAPLPEHWSLIDAVAINDAGQILARGQWASGDFKPIEHALLLTPVPEPACALLAAAVSAALLRRPRWR